MAGSTQRPRVIASCNTNSAVLKDRVAISPISFLNKIITKHPFLELIPDSLLAVAIINEYSNVQSPRTTRPDWPAGLCGYIEATIGKAKRLNKLNPASFAGIVNKLPDTKYDQDDCIQPQSEITLDPGRFGVSSTVRLAVRQPGTLPYSRDCETIDLIQDIYDVDWTGYFRTPVYPAYEDLDEETLAQVDEQFGPIITLAEETSIAFEEGVFATEAAIGPANSSGGVGAGSAGFLWKPISESNGRLVILLPSSYRGKVLKCIVVMSSGAREEGRFAGDSHNGARPHFRFSLPGRSYGTNIVVKAVLRSGGSKPFTVANGAARTEG